MIESLYHDATRARPPDCAMAIVGKDLFGAEPFDPFTCGAADFPPDIQTKLDEMQVSPRPSPQLNMSLSHSLAVHSVNSLVHGNWQVPHCALSQQIDLNWSVKQVNKINALW